MTRPTLDLPPVGETILTLDSVSKSYGPVKAARDVKLEIPRGSIYGFLGPNGAGKTTLFRMLVGEERPDSGTIKVGDTVTLSYVDQSRDTLDPEKTIWEVVSGGQDTLELGSRQVNSRAYVAKFNFTGGEQQQAIHHQARTPIGVGAGYRLHEAGGWLERPAPDEHAHPCNEQDDGKFTTQHTHTAILNIEILIKQYPRQVINYAWAVCTNGGNYEKFIHI